MLGSISPVGERARNQRWWLTATAFTLASVVAGGALGLVLGAAGGLLAGGTAATLRLGLLAIVVVTAAVADAGLLGLRVPSWHRQVDERWLTSYRGWVYGAGFGAQLGVGLATIVPSGATYAALAAAFLSAGWRPGLTVGVVFGAVRSLPVLLAAGLTTADRLYAVMRRVSAAEPRVHRVTIAGQTAVVAALLLTLVVAR